MQIGKGNMKNMEIIMDDETVNSILEEVCTDYVRDEYGAFEVIKDNEEISVIEIKFPSNCYQTFFLYFRFKMM